MIDVGALVRVEGHDFCLTAERGIIVGREWGPVTSGPTFPRWTGYYKISFKGNIRQVHERFVRVEPSGSVL